MTPTYQVIARKWRPQVFSDMVGQEHVVKTLSNAIAKDMLAHAYLFVGPRGTGKTTTARILAKALNCTGGPKVDFDPNDPACVSIADGTHLDVIEIDGASNNGVDQVRALRDTVQYSPTQGKYKIYIIDEVHMLSSAAFNALLKTLEEPPAHVKFIFATTEPQKVLATIISRCQRFDLRPIPANLIVQQLQKISAAEGISVDVEALHGIAKMADGGMRDAQSILDQLISFCGKHITENDVLNVYGLVSRGTIETLAKAIAQGNYVEIFRITSECDQQGRDFIKVLIDLEEIFRRALLLGVQSGAKVNILGVSLTTEQVSMMLDTLHDRLDKFRTHIVDRTNFEIALLKISDTCKLRSIDSVIKDINACIGQLPK